MSAKDSPTPAEAVERLRVARLAYTEALSEVVNHGADAVPHLVAALVDKRSLAPAEALGFLMQAENAHTAFPRLLDWLCAQTPMYPYALNALVKVGAKILPLWRQRALEANATDDDEALRNLFDLACRFGEFGRAEIIEVVGAIIERGWLHSVESILDALPHLPSDIAQTFADQIDGIRQENPDSSIGESAAAVLRHLDR